ncbi:MAG: hypothetical protein HC873_18080, partial [Leptolyngbyaceae cyanobacterium SL_1_1]|nr:hypothetical protein [Leptolyngbyaceae cyanobacterium SL_1_1]
RERVFLDAGSRVGEIGAAAIAGKWPKAIAAGSSAIPLHRAAKTYPIDRSERVGNLKIIP